MPRKRERKAGDARLKRGAAGDFRPGETRSRSVREDPSMDCEPANLTSASQEPHIGLTSLHLQKKAASVREHGSRFFLPEAPGRFELPVEVLQTSALPLGYGAGPTNQNEKGESSSPFPDRERDTGLEPATFTLAT